MPPPRVYMQVSRSGQIRTPYIQASSPMLTMAVRSLSDCDSAEDGLVLDGPLKRPSPNTCWTPSRKRAPPTPPTRTVTFTLTDIRRSGPASFGQERDRAV